MSKKQRRKIAVEKPLAGSDVPVQPEAAPLGFGFDEMLGELEAIITEAEGRLAQEARTM